MIRPFYRIVRKQPVPDALGLYFVDLSAIAKENAQAVPYCIPNELICGEIGRLLGLPIPPIGLISPTAVAAPDEIMVATLDFNFTGVIALPAIEPADCVSAHPWLSAGTVVFDILIANPDRTRDNLSLDTSVTPPRLSVFDHGDALFGHDKGKGADRLAEVETQLGIIRGGSRHCLIDKLTVIKDLQEWIDRVRGIPSYFLDDVCSRADGLGATTAEIEAAKNFLKHRRDSIHQLIEHHKAEFKGIDTKLWSSLT